MIDIRLEKYIHEFMTELRGDTIDPNTVISAKSWYKRFTGKEYTDQNIKDLVEMYRIINEVS